jgi:uncharacterized protein VirK/YbjX
MNLLKKPVRLLQFAANLRGHMALSRSMTLAGMPQLTRFFRTVRYRYLRRFYLGGGFPVGDRLAVATHHYLSLARQFQPGFLMTLRGQGYCLWRYDFNGELCEIHLRLPYSYNHDGDMCLALGYERHDLCIITLSIAPGPVVGSPEKQVLLISGIQGFAGRIQQIRKVTESCNNVSPPHLLIMAAEALAERVGAGAVVGIGASQMATAPQMEKGRSSFDYDAFWMSLTGREQAHDSYHMTLPFVDKPIELILAKHRGRARKRRQLRSQMRERIHAQANQVLATRCLQ